ncbi:MAG: hypothetical protein AABZ55_01765 [Bdellovibrionota bacterium]
MERRLSSTGKSSPLPQDYLKMVGDVFKNNFDAGLKALNKITSSKIYFKAIGEIFTNEVVLCVSLLEKGQLAATTVYASLDFDPKANKPTVQDLLDNAVDAIGAVYNTLLNSDDPKVLEQISARSLAALEDVPFEWTSVVIEKRKVYVMLDKSNPEIDAITDEWLDANDPDRKKREALEQQQTEELFVTGPKGTKNPKGSSGTGTLH